MATTNRKHVDAAVIDEWSANPYPAGHPKFMEFEETRKSAQRSNLVRRFGHQSHSTDATKLRTADYQREMYYGEKSPDRSSSPQMGSGQKKADVPPKPTADIRQSYGCDAVCMVTLQGGAVICCGHKDGSITLRNGISGDVFQTILTYTEKKKEEAPKEEKKEGTFFDKLADAAEDATQGTKLGNAVAKANDKLGLGTDEDEANKKKDEEAVDPEAPSPVTQLLSIQNYLIACTDNGNVMCFDTLIHVKSWVAPLAHSGGVCYIAHMPSTSQFLTVGRNGRLVVWSEPDYQSLGQSRNNPAPLNYEKTLQQAMTPLVAGIYSGEFLFLTEGQHIIKLDPTDLGLIVKAPLVKPSPQAKPPTDEQKAAAASQISCLACFKTWVIVGGSCGVRIHDQASLLLMWTVPHHGQGAAVQRVQVETRMQRAWSVDKSGKLICWDLNPDTKFKQRLCKQFSSPVVTLTEMCHIDGARLWTLPSSGVNAIFWTAFAVAQSEMEGGIEEMKAWIQHDEEEIALWEKKIQTLEKIKARRMDHGIDNLMRCNDLGLRRVYYWKLMNNSIAQQQIKRRMTVARALTANTDTGLRRIYFAAMRRFAHQQRMLKQRRAIAENLLCCTDRGMQKVYFRRLVDNRREKRAERKKREMGELMLRNTDGGMRRIFWRKWVDCSVRGHYKRKRKELSDSMLRTTSQGIMKIYYLKMLRFRALSKKNDKKKAIAEAMLSTTSKGLTKIYFIKLRAGAKLQKAIKLRKKWGEKMYQHSNFAITQHYYIQWGHFCKQKRQEKLNAKLEGLRDQNKKLMEEYKLMEVRIEKQKLVKANESEMKSLTDKRTDLNAEKDKAQKHIDELTVELEAKRKQEKKNASLRDEFLNTMNTLKTKALNFDSDYPLVTKVVDKTKSTTAAKIFLSSHIEVKRVVVTQTGEPKDGMKWNLGNGVDEIKKAVAKFPSHAHSAIVNSIKTMVIAFDLMTAKDLESLDTDDEIVANAEGIVTMYDTLVLLLSKRKK